MALLAAIALHLAVLLVVLRQREPDPLSDAFTDAVSVEMVPLSALAPPPLPPADKPSPDEPPVEASPAPATPAPATPALATPAPATPAPAQQKPAPPSTAPGMIRPTTMLSARSLAKSRQTRLALRTLTSDTRIEQLCGLEAMEQIHAWQRDYQPDRMVVYAMGEPTMIGDMFEADGAAFRSRSLWYTIRFSCELTPDHARVAGFAFAVGAPVPRDNWEDHGLPAVH